MMAEEQRLIDINRAIASMQKILDDNQGAQGSVAYLTFKALIECLKQEPIVDAVEVEDKELLKAIKMLIKQYEHSKQSDYVYSPVAHAFYHTWKQIDKGRKRQ